MTASSATGSLSLLMNPVASHGVDLDAVFDRCADGLYRYFAVRTGGDPHLADDLMQQLWLQAVRHAGRIPADAAEPWLRTVAANLIREHWRRQRRRPAHVPIADAALAADLARRLVTEELPEDVLVRREVHDQLLLAITLLCGDDQRLLLGRYVHGRSHAELARELGIGDRAVEGRLYRARQALRVALAELAA